MVLGYFVEKGILLQRPEQGVLGRTGHGTDKACSNFCQTSQVATTMRRGEKDKTLRRCSDTAIVRGVDARFDEGLLHEETAQGMRNEDQTPVFFIVLLALEIQTAEKSVGV